MRRAMVKCRRYIYTNMTLNNSACLAATGGAEVIFGLVCCLAFVGLYC